MRPPRFPADRGNFLFELLPGGYRTVTREGVGRFALQYWDSSLAPLLGVRVWVAHDDRNISKVYVKHDDEWITVPWTNREAPPCTLNEFSFRREAAKQSGGERPSGDATLNALREQRRIEDTAKAQTRQSRERREQRPIDDPYTVDADVNYASAPAFVGPPF